MTNQLFNIENVPNTGIARSDSIPGIPPQSTSVGVISAQQSAITFAGAPAAVTLVWKVLGAIDPAWGNSKPLAIGLSLIVGMFIYWQSAPIDGTTREKTIGFVFALINSFAIAAAALGISSTTQ